MPSVHPYLNFNGNCGEAFDFYKSAFGGEFATKMFFKDAPADPAMPPSEGGKIMHVALPIGKATVLMGSDRPGSFGSGKIGENFTVSIQVDSEDEAKKLFTGLSAGGKVVMPLDKTFWGAYFGMFTDKFGIQWMVNYDYNQHK